MQAEVSRGVLPVVVYSNILHRVGMKAEEKISYTALQVVQFAVDLYQTKRPAIISASLQE